MPIVNIQLWAGRSEEVKEQLIEALTDATVQTLGVPAEAVSVIITEVDKKNWGIGGVPADKWQPD